MNIRNWKLRHILGASLALYGIKSCVCSIYSLNNQTIDVCYNERSVLNKALADDKAGFLNLLRSFKPAWFYMNPLSGAIVSALV